MWMRLARQRFAARKRKDLVEWLGELELREGGQEFVSIVVCNGLEERNGRK